MNPELAMEQYITLLSDKFPGWMEEKLMGERKQEESSGVGGAGASGVSEPDVCSLVKEEPNSGNERKLEFHHHNEGGKMTGDSDSQEYAESDALQPDFMFCQGFKFPGSHFTLFS
ncbi:hypothetical protein QJS10_CPA03g02242 [Acorus calamus]|uniref:ACB domain-containing protein n=1 Tax=Acorus calamus TaxID=4465 RepID=A0AAV9F6E7_ACOCL|nr:hypothetical protein QJS10_CPA03g02242 [Acorus calamus]